MEKTLPPAFKLEEARWQFECGQDLTLAKAYLLAAAPHVEEGLEALDLPDTAALIDRETLRVKIQDGERWRLAVLEKALEEIGECRHTCWCALDAWDQFLMGVNEALEDFHDHLWASTEGKDFEGNLRVAELAEYLVGGADEPTRFKVEWDGEDVLHVEMETDTSTLYQVRFHPLDGDQEHAYELLVDDDPWEEQGLRKVRDLPRNLLLATIGFADQQRYDENDERWGFKRILAELREAGFDGLDEARQEVVARLAPEWEGTPAELVETARAV